MSTAEKNQFHNLCPNCKMNAWPGELDPWFTAGVWLWHLCCPGSSDNTPVITPHRAQWPQSRITQHWLLIHSEINRKIIYSLIADHTNQFFIRTMKCYQICCDRRLLLLWYDLSLCPWLMSSCHLISSDVIWCQDDVRMTSLSNSPSPRPRLPLVSSLLVSLTVSI